MWSNLQGNSPPEKEWRPNHFVTLIQMYPEENESFTVGPAEIEELSPIAFLEDSDDDSLNTSLINGIINELIVESPTVEQAPSSLAQEQPIPKQPDLEKPIPVSDVESPTVEPAPSPLAQEQPITKQPDLEKPIPVSDVEPCVDQTVINDHMGNDDDEQTVDGLVLSEDSTKYKVGDFLLSNCGIKTCPCLVVQTPDDMEALPHAGVWVQYLKKARASLWTLENKPFFLEYRNICNSLEPPSLTAAGTRIYYKLKL